MDRYKTVLRWLEEYGFTIVKRNDSSAYWHNDCRLRTKKITELVNEFRKEYDKRYEVEKVEE